MPSSAARRFWHLDSFSGGLDRREGTFAKSQNHFYDLVNYRTQNTKKLKRRAPCGRNATAFVNAQGLIEWRGALYTVAKKGDAVTKPSDVTGELRFDNPDYCTTWTLAGLRTFSGVPVAIIKHTFSGGTVTYQYRLHVFDGKANKPTYVEDPWCPIGWGPKLPLHLYRTGTLGAFDPNWVPRMHECGGRLYIPQPDGKTAFCKTGNARTWNERTVEEMVDGGEWWYFITSTTVGVQNFIVSENYANLFATSTWAAFVLEYLDTTGTWQQVTEDIIAPTVDKHYQPQSVASRFAGYANEVRLAVNWTGGGGTVLRFRLCLKPAVENVSITALTDRWGRGYITAGSLNYESASLARTEVESSRTYYGTSHSVGGKWSNNYTTGNPLAITDFKGVNKNKTWYAFIGRDTHNMQWDRSDGAYSTTYVRDSGWSQFQASGFWSFPGQLRYRNRVLYGWLNPDVLDYSGTNVISASAFAAGETTITVPTALTAGDLIYVQPGVIGGTVYIVKDTGTAVRIHDTLDVAGNYTADAVVASTVYNLLAGVTLVSFYYGYETGHQSPFYLDRVTEYQLNLAGADDAGELPTASQQGSDGGYVTALSAMKDRLMVCYKGGTQMWSVAGLPADHALLGFGPAGTGDQVYAEPRPVGQSVVLGMSRGMMSLNLTGSNLDSMRDINLGEPIEQLGFPQQQDAAFWPETGQYVTAVVMPDASRQFLVFDYSQEQKINAWGRWIVASLPAVERFSMVPKGKKLYFRAGGYLYSFDLAATDYIDAHDDTALAYESSVKLHFNHLEAPWRMKQAIALEWVMSGVVTVAIRWNPDLPDEETGEIVYTGMTGGRASVPVSVWGHGLAPVIRSRDRAGHEIEEIGMWFIVRGR